MTTRKELTLTQGMGQHVTGVSHVLVWAQLNTKGELRHMCSGLPPIGDRGPESWVPQGIRLCICDTKLPMQWDVNRANIKLQGLPPNDSGWVTAAGAEEAEVEEGKEQDDDEEREGKSTLGGGRPAELLEKTKKTKWDAVGRLNIRMEHNETKCDYCGVSYLTLYENRQLQTKLAQSEAKLQEWKETAQREKAQLEARELNRLEQERELQAQAEVREKTTREELEKRYQDMMKIQKDEFEAISDRTRRKMEADHQKIQKIIEEKERQLRREIEDLMVEELRKQREELKKSAEERETVRKICAIRLTGSNDAQTLAQQVVVIHLKFVGLGTADNMKDKAEEKLGKEKQNVETLRGACVRRQQILRKTLTVLRLCGSGFTDLQGFLRQLTGAWQTCSSQILQHCRQGFSDKAEFEEIQKLKYQDLLHSSLPAERNEVSKRQDGRAEREGE
ncbi:hypothetical protein CCH79_00003664 [Gambusia affinis]|uniref:Uncharacterized protein n=1 Tax=Gambusia affinis TaxID=33528 RepID=A0A315VBS6_GAMAF|nr:hypothetical protein CCH79_00003664 [Gambusia affinis]